MSKIQDMRDKADAAWRVVCKLPPAKPEMQLQPPDPNSAYAQAINAYLLASIELFFETGESHKPHASAH